jgi:hypothetical protein
MMAKTAMRKTTGPDLQFAQNIPIHELVGKNIFMGPYQYKNS